MMVFEVDAAAEPQVHTIDCEADVLDAIERGEAMLSVGRSNRRYQVGDRLVLRRVEPDGQYTMTSIPGGTVRKELYRRIDHVRPGGQGGLDPAIVMLGIQPIPLKAER